MWCLTNTNRCAHTTRDVHNRVHKEKKKRKSLHQCFPLPREGANTARPHTARSQGQPCSVAKLNTDPKDCLCSVCHQLQRVILLLTFPSCSRKQAHISFVCFHCHHLSENCTGVLRLMDKPAGSRLSSPWSCCFTDPPPAPPRTCSPPYCPHHGSDEMCTGTASLRGGFRKDALGSHLTRG